jgi:predicted GTPase
MASKMRHNINIAIIGPVSAGKSTLLNTLFVSQYSDMKIKRTTMTPQVYFETKDTDVSIDDMLSVKSINKIINDDLINKTENGENITLEDIKECNYYIPKVHKLIELENEVYLSIYDIPGLNDFRTKNIYYQYINNNFYKFDIIIFVIDINSALNTSDEKEILEMILNNCKENKEKYNICNNLIVLVNKCDELFIKNNILIMDDEHNEMFEQVKNTINQQVNSIYSNLVYCILPISCEDSYIYRMYDRYPDYDLDMKHMNKFGNNEFGKKVWNRFSDEQKKGKIKELMNKMDLNYTLFLTGFNQFKNKLKNYLTKPKQYTYLLNHIKYDMSKISLPNNYEIELDEIYTIYCKIIELNNIFQKNYDINGCLLSFINSYFNKYSEIINNDINNITDSNINIVKDIKDKIILCKNKLLHIDIFDNIINDIDCKINKYYLDNIEKNEKDFEEVYNFIDILIKSKYKIEKEYIYNLFQNKSICKVINNRIIEILDYFKNENIFTIDDINRIIYDILIERYINFYDGNGNIFTNIDINSYPFMTMMFWNSKCNDNWELFKYPKIKKLCYYSNIMFKNIYSVIDKNYDIVDNLELEYYFYKNINKT